MSNINLQPGIVLIDKPSGWTSHDLLAKIRRLSGIKTVGHAGTLDPLATGLLIVLVGKEFTKRQTEFLKQDKKYECTLQLGLETDTYDIEGQIINQADWPKVKIITRQQAAAALTKFVGEIWQTVPAFSAVKIKGHKLYDLARKQQTADLVLPQKQVQIFALELTNFTVDSQQHKLFIQLKIHCSSGTYIRSLAHDLGLVLGVGACVTQLRRTKIGDFSVTSAKKLIDLYP